MPLESPARKESKAMQTVKLKVNVRNRRIAEELPPEIPDGEAEMVINFEEQSSA